VQSYPIRRLGILRLSAIGDVIHAMPLAMGLRRAFPRAHITWVVQSAAAPLLDRHPAVDETLVYPRRGEIGEILRFVKRLWECRFDATVDPQGNSKSGVIGLVSGAPVRAGLHLRDCKEWFNALCTNRHARPARGAHGVDRAWCAGAPLGVGHGPDDWGLAARPEEREGWRRRCREAGADPDGPLLAVHLTDPTNARSWFPEPLALTVHAAAREGLQVILNGTAERRDLARKISGPRIHDLTGRDDLRGLLAQFECMAQREGNLLLSPDSGPVHLAAAVGLRTICLSGPQDPRRTGPRRGGTIVSAWEGLECAPCLERACILDPPERTCMARISVEAVLARIWELSGRGRSRSA
jgi:ADP-heptose:LPS heptosyltransferase